MRGSLQDRVAIVTGASRGIGKQIALDLAASGMQVVVAARSVRSRDRLPGTVDETVREIEAAGGQAVAVQTDVRDAEAIQRLVAGSREAFGGIHLVVHNAGALWWRPILETPAKRFDLVMSVNVRAAFLLAQAAAKAMIETDQGGHILFISPPLDDRPLPGMVAYTVSKFGMTVVALGLAEELRPHRIAVNTLWPATLIESLATLNWRIGERWMWRQPTILSDAVLALARKDPASFTGRQLIDEDLLRGEGVTDFSAYRCDPDREPPRVALEELPHLLATGEED
jgi:citronellol/citronellal dehydrogenase